MSLMVTCAKAELQAEADKQSKDVFYNPMLHLIDMQKTDSLIGRSLPILAAAPTDLDMAYYRVWRTDDEHGEVYWVAAPSRLAARRLVALNCGAAADAERLDKFQCEPSSAKMPPSGVIYCRLGAPIRIENT